MEIIKPHNKTSREVTGQDLETVKGCIAEMVRLCNTRIGRHNGGYALAHSQVESEDPLRFFVSSDGDVIVNPVIVRKTTVPVLRVEGCMSFPHRMPIHIPRHTKCEVSFHYYNQDTGELEGPYTENLNGTDAEVFQHEIDHMDGKYVFELTPNE